jgi:hypothetical protein
LARTIQALRSVPLAFGPCMSKSSTKRRPKLSRSPGTALSLSRAAPSNASRNSGASRAVIPNFEAKTLALWRPRRCVGSRQ